MRTDAELRFEKYINPVWSLFTVALLRDSLQYYKKDLGTHTIGESAVRYNDIFIQDIQDKKITVDYAVIDTLLYGEKTNKHSEYKNILSCL